MKPIYDMKLIQIEITNACTHQCANCTRLVGHHRKPFFMNLDNVKKALESLEGYKGNIGMMGGEPTLHPKFSEVCKLYQELIPDKSRRELWTSGFKWNKYKSIIKETFDEERIAYNDHSSEDGQHQPLLVAAEEIIEDKELMWNLIDNCWVQSRWSASITPKGCFFCEVAAAMDHAFNGPGGYPIKKGWWKKTPKDFSDQVCRYCPKCSGAIPLQLITKQKVSDKEQYDTMSKNNAEKLKQLKSPKCLRNDYVIYDKKVSEKNIKEKIKGWEPQNYRTFVAHSPEDYKK